MSNFGFGSDPSQQHGSAQFGTETGGASTTGTGSSESESGFFSGFNALDTLSVLTQVGSVALAHDQAQEAETNRRQRRKQLQKQRQERRRELKRMQREEQRRRINQSESTAQRSNRTRGRDLLLGQQNEEDESATETLG